MKPTFSKRPFIARIGALVLVATVLAGCENLFGEEEEEDGTLSVTVTDIVEGGPTYGVGGVFPAGANPDEGAEPLAANYKELTPSSITVQAKIIDSDNQITSTNWQGSGGERYDVYVWATSNLDGNSQAPAEGDYTYQSFPISYKQDGDESLVVSANDFVAY